MKEYNEKEIKELNLWQKISSISTEIEYLQKDDSVGYGNSAYKAISSEKVINIVASKLNKYGVVLYPIEQHYNRTDEKVKTIDKNTKKEIEKINRISDVDIKYEVVNIDKPSEKITTVSSGTGVDTQDKGIGKAQTYAYKNMLIKLFAIPTGEDTDKIHSEEYTKELTSQENNDKVKIVLSEKQLKRLYAIAHKKGYDKSKLDKMVLKKFNCLPSLLNKEQYDSVCSGLESIK